MEAVTMQQGLNEVVINKVQKMIENKQSGVQATMERLINESKISHDHIAPIGVNMRMNDRKPVITFIGNGHVLMNMEQEQYSLHDNAVGQLADKMGIPSRYLRQLSGGDEWQRQLASTVLNEHSSWTQRQKVLIRSVGTEVRGVLSDSYRRLNSIEIITAFVQQAVEQGAAIADAFMSDTKIWTETILPMPVTIPTRKNGDVIMFVGARFSTSDYGDGAVDMRTFLLNGACLNGMVRESVMKQVHLGSKLPDNLALSNRTYELDTQTTVSAIRDLTKGLFDKETIMQKAIEIQGSSEIDVDMDIELKKLVKASSLMKPEAEAVQKILMQNNPDDGVTGGSTLWKLTQGITAYAREIEPRRSRELAEISGALLNRIGLSV
jgi:hypothetical protein